MKAGRRTISGLGTLAVPDELADFVEQAADDLVVHPRLVIFAALERLRHDLAVYGPDACFRGARR